MRQNKLFCREADTARSAIYKRRGRWEPERVTYWTRMLDGSCSCEALNIKRLPVVQSSFQRPILPITSIKISIQNFPNFLHE